MMQKAVAGCAYLNSGIEKMGCGHVQQFILEVTNNRYEVTFFTTVHTLEVLRC